MKTLCTSIIFISLIIINSQAQSCFSKNWSGNGLDHMNFYISKASHCGIDLKAGDEVGIFDQDACVGYGVLTQELTEGLYLSVITSKDDPDTPEKEGFSVNNTVSFKLCIKNGDPVIVNAQAEFIQGEGVFIEAGTALVELFTAMPSSPLLDSIAQPSCSVSTGSLRLGGLPTGQWTINRGAITGSSSLHTIPDLGPGSYSFTVTNSAGCTSSVSDNIIITPQPETPSVPIIGAITHPTDSVTRGSIVLEGLPTTGNWILNPGIISGTGSGILISGLHSGTYSFSVTNSSGCVSESSEFVVINEPSITYITKEFFSDLRIFPNPSISSVFLDFGKVHREKIRISITNIKGEVISSGVYKNYADRIIRIDLTQLSSGYYFFTIMNEVGNEKVFRFIKL